jgi:tetratricopeptide (TPR) repeat protein
MPLWQALGDPYDLVIARNNYAGTLWSMGSLDGAAALFSESIAVARSSMYAQLLPEMLANLGYLEQHRRNFDASETLLLESLELFRRSEDRFGTVFVLTQLGATVEARGDRRRAESYYHESLTLNRAVENRGTTVQCLEGLARLADDAGDVPRAIRLATAASHERERLSPPAELGVSERADDLLARLRDRESPETFARATASVANRTTDEIVAEELAESAPA